MTRTWLIVIGGFTQRSGFAQPVHGCQRLYQRLENRFGGDGGRTTVVALEWRDDMRAAANRIADESDANPRILVFAYSWGVGRGARLLAHYLETHNLWIDLLVSSDGVAHTVWLWSRVRALIPSREPRGRGFTRGESLRRLVRCSLWRLGVLIPRLVPVIQLPANVLRVLAFRQSRNLPMGHDIEVAGREGAVQYLRAEVPHVAMDDLRDWQDRCIECAMEAVG